MTYRVGGASPSSRLPPAGEGKSHTRDIGSFDQRTAWGTTPPGTPSAYREVLTLSRCTGLGDPAATGRAAARTRETTTNSPTANPAYAALPATPQDRPR